FMRRFSDLPAMETEGESHNSNEPQSSAASPSNFALRCSGCGAKVGSTILDRALRRIQQNSPRPDSRPLIGLDAPDDAAVIQVPSGLALVQTIDYFPALLNDPFLFGQISTQHALSDLFAMGAQPHSALALATIPYGAPAQVEETLYQLLAGATRGLAQANASLIGGHTIEGPNLAFGLACNGFADPDRLLRKGGMQPGQALILTKAIGTGTLFAAQMRLQAKGRWIEGAVASMLLSNQAAATCFLAHGATACTDITGFGLLGHLLEMVRASGVAVELELEAIPWLEGALETVQRGIVSSLQPQNSQAAAAIANLTQASRRPHFPLLFDPQTSGGLLASVPVPQANACVAALQSLGYGQSAIVGYTISRPTIEDSVSVNDQDSATDSDQPITIA
ncbi:MAG TPA: selenide, water dikinase SelD, partial [Thermosynechococcaceae cyanobacterium]